jgi:hypothetical protein
MTGYPLGKHSRDLRNRYPNTDLGITGTRHWVRMLRTKQAPSTTLSLSTLLRMMYSHGLGRPTEITLPLSILAWNRPSFLSFANRSQSTRHFWTYSMPDLVYQRGHWQGATPWRSTAVARRGASRALPSLKRLPQRRSVHTRTSVHW